jgi:hypothetical protein
MANPNIVNVTAIYGKTALATLSTVTANIVTNASGSNTVLKMNNIILSNYSSLTVSANVILNRSSTLYFLGGNVSVPAFSTLVLVAKDTSLYIEEGDVIQANVSANASITMTASYEQIN